jgi:plastocyanin
MALRGTVPSRMAAALAAALFAAVPVQADNVAEVTIAQNRFMPAHLKVKAGTTVRWNSAERRASHMLAVSGPARAQSGPIAPGQSWSHTFTQPGTYQYSCVPHPEMKGVVEVTE